jgi:uncharacterized membrane protein
MLKSYDRDRIIIGLFIIARLIFCCYRAAHQSVVADEAFTFIRFVDGPWNKVYTLYDSNNHVLYSLLAKLSIRAFGISEFTLRLPSLIAGLLLLVGVAKVLRRLVVSKTVAVLAVVAIGIHPLLLEFCIAARGYGLSLAAFVWALWFAMESSYIVAGALLGAAIASNLAITFPALAFCGAWILVGCGSRRERLIASSTMVFVATAVSVIVYSPILAFMLSHRNYFYTGYPSFRAALFALILASFHYKLPAFTGLFGNYPASEAILWLFLPLVAGFISVSAWRIAHRDERVKLLPAATLALSLLGLAAAHAILGLPYPAERTWLYTVILFGMAWAIASDNAQGTALSAVNLVLAAAVMMQFASQLQTEYFETWSKDRDMRRISEMIRDDSIHKAPNSVTVSATWLHQPALEFYRRRLAITSLREVERLDPTQFSGYEYYVFSGEDDPDRSWREGFAVLFWDSEVRVMLARRHGVD